MPKFRQLCVKVGQCIHLLPVATTKYLRLSASVKRRGLYAMLFWRPQGMIQMCTHTGRNTCVGEFIQWAYRSQRIHDKLGVFFHDSLFPPEITVRLFQVYLRRASSLTLSPSPGFLLLKVNICHPGDQYSNM